MRRATGFAIALVLLAVPAGAAAKPPTDDDGPRNAAQECRSERADAGVEAFREQHGTNANKRDAFGKCVRAKRHEARDERHAARTERRQARAERRAARAERRAARRARRTERRNAARDCRAERGEMGVEAFREQYGTNRNKRNAFGKCVSQTVKAGREDDGDDEDDGSEEPDPES